jgi:hypothetical protein
MIEDLQNVKETEWWWIDYLENELDSSLERDLELLLEHSQEDRDSFENFRLLRQWVRESDPIAQTPLENRIERVRGNVMNAILKMDLEAKPSRAETAGSALMKGP